MGCGVELKSPHDTFFKKLSHKLFGCPTFWSIKPAFKCPICGKKYRCYWDGNDIDGHGIDICNECASDINKARKEKS